MGANTDIAVIPLGVRIVMVSQRLLATAIPQAADLNHAHYLAHLALRRLLNDDPDLSGFQELLCETSHCRC